MYRNLFRAEWTKIAGNRMASMFFIWIFPVGMAVIGILGIIGILISDDFAEAQRVTGVYTWDRALLSTWMIVNSLIGRWVIIAFAAFVFAGEYKHGTWKNLTTRRQRTVLIVNKFVTLAVFVTVAFTMMSLISGVLTGVIAGILDLDYGLSNAGDVMGDFLRDYALQMFLTLTGTFISAAFAAAAAMITRNIMASVIVGIFFYMLEFVGMIVLFALIELVLGINLARLYPFLPSYNLDNIASWVVRSEGLPLSILDIVMEPHTILVSVLIVAAWVIALVGTTAYLFYRQDITT